MKMIGGCALIIAVAIAAAVLAFCDVVTAKLHSNPSSPNCGIQLFEDRIIGGNVTSLTDYPWAALFRYYHKQKDVGNWGCSGSYIGGRTILTAAHCVDEISRRDLGEILFVRLGEYDTETNPDCVKIEDDKDCNDTPFDSAPQRIIIHPKRTVDSKDYDIAVVIMETKPPYTDFIRPICLPGLMHDSYFDQDEILFVTGWGYTINGFIRSPSNVKRHVKIEAVHNDVCLRQYENIFINPNSQSCAGGRSGRNPCRGDSGGPLMRLVRRDYWELIGIVSFGPGVCGIDGIDGKPAVFTKVQYFIPWVVENAL